MSSFKVLPPKLSSSESLNKSRPHAAAFSEMLILGRELSPLPAVGPRRCLQPGSRVSPVDDRAFHRDTVCIFSLVVDFQCDIPLDKAVCISVLH